MSVRHGWSLERRHWRQADDSVVGLNWKRVPFANLHQESVPEKAGVYVVCSAGLAANAGLFGLLYNALYVGQARNLRRRFLQHRRSPKGEMVRVINCFKSLEFWCASAELEDLDRLEALLIDCLGPTANQQAGIRAYLGEAQKI